MKPILYLAIVVALSVAPFGAQAQEASASPSLGVRARTLALGFTVDVLPIVLSASAGDVGMSGQVWIGVDHLRLRLVGATFSQPGWLSAKDGFRDRDTAVMAVIVDYVFGDHFDRWWVGTGFELWYNSIGHEDAAGQRAAWSNVVWTAGGGYIWRVVGNFYVEPWIAGHVIMNDPDVILAGKAYTSLPVMGEISLKIGWFLDL